MHFGNAIFCGNTCHIQATQSGIHTTRTTSSKTKQQPKVQWNTRKQQQVTKRISHSSGHMRAATHAVH